MDDAEIRKLARLEDRHWWYAARRDLLRRLAGPAPASGRQPAYDVGAAAGGNSRVLRELGWDVVALEWSAAGAGIARERGIDVVRADAQRLPFASGTAGLVALLDVIEHLPDDRAALAEVRRVLRPGGRAVVAVPADPRLWSAHDEAVGHLRRYTRDTLSAAVASAGLRTDALWSWNVLLRPLVALRRRLGRDEGSDLAEVPAPVNAALRVVLRAEDALPVGRWPGVSLVVTAHRPPDG